MNLNELGDLLAGLFGPLAIFWVVLGFFQQGKELQNSVDALNLQARELKNSVEQQERMVQATYDTLEHENAVLGLERAQHKRSLQPVFDIVFGAKVWFGTGKGKFHVAVTNTGHDATHFCLDVFVNDELFLSTKSRHLKNGDSCGAEKPKEQKPPKGKITAVATYTDAEQDKLEKHFLIEGRTEGNLVVYSVTEVTE